MKIKITSINYGRTINLGNYESSRIDFTAQVNDNETYEEVLDQLKVLVHGEEARIREERELSR